MSKRKEVLSKDIPVSEINSSYKTKCIVCGHEIELRWHNGELDYEECCGYEYELSHKIVELTVYESE